MRSLAVVVCVARLSFATTAAAQTRDGDAGLDHLRLLSGSIQALVKRVSPSVVPVVVTAYTALEQSDGGQADLVMGKQRSIGSGVVVGGDGYIMTNAHVVKGARSVQVILSAPSRTVRATIVGVADEIDLALLKVDVSGLPALPLADYEQIRQGELVGINTFIISNSGGSEGMGFAIPSSLVAMAYPKLRTFGHLHRGQTGMLLQTITPTLAAGLGLGPAHGVIVADVVAGGCAEAAGLQIGDVIESVDGRQVDSILPVAMRLFTSDGDERMTVGVIRSGRKRTFTVAIAAKPDDLDQLTDLLDPESSVVPALGILAVDINEKTTSLVPSLRWPVGVIVAAHAPQGGSPDVALLSGDVIHSVNGIPVTTVDALRALIGAVKPHDAVVLQVERNGQLSFLAFEAD
jgi:S1-C subfamily serine protease